MCNLSTPHKAIVVISLPMCSTYQWSWVIFYIDRCISYHPQYDLYQLFEIKVIWLSYPGNKWRHRSHDLFCIDLVVASILFMKPKCSHEKKPCVSFIMRFRIFEHLKETSLCDKFLKTLFINNCYLNIINLIFNC